jgi:hypothetical protein
MQKPITLKDEMPRAVQRADRRPTEGFSLVVDGRMKSNYANDAAATEVATALKQKYPMLQVQVYDATSGERRQIT